MLVSWQWIRGTNLIGCYWNVWPPVSSESESEPCCVFLLLYHRLCLRCDCWDILTDSLKPLWDHIDTPEKDPHSMMLPYSNAIDQLMSDAWFSPKNWSCSGGWLGWPSHLSPICTQDLWSSARVIIWPLFMSCKKTCFSWLLCLSSGPALGTNLSSSSASV